MSLHVHSYDVKSFDHSPIVLRERYLRNDVGCGISSCALCSSSPDTSSSTHHTLPASGSVEHTLFPDGHFVLPDTNIFLAQVCDGFCFGTTTTAIRRAGNCVPAAPYIVANTYSCSQTPDGFDRINTLCPTYHCSSNSLGRSATQISTVVQSPQGFDENG